MRRPIIRIQSPLKPLRVAIDCDRPDGSIWFRSSQVSLCIAAATRRRRGRRSVRRLQRQQISRNGGEGDLEPRAGGVVSDAGRRHGIRRPHVHRLLLHLLSPEVLAKVAVTKYYEATSSRRSRSLAKEIATSAVASVFLGFGSLFVLLASGVYV